MRILLLLALLAGCSAPYTVGDEAVTIGTSLCSALDRCNPDRGVTKYECLTKYLDIVCSTVDCEAESHWTPDKVQSCADAIDAVTCDPHPPLEECKDIIGS
jgi:hypothetical protein